MPVPATNNATGAPTGYPSWTYAFLQAIGAPQTATNLYALQEWAASEDDTLSYLSSYNNPLATELSAGSQGVVPKSPNIPAFPTLASGAAAFASSLNGGIQGAGAIKTALVNGDSLQQIFQAINGSGWCSGCQNGQYPTALYSNLSSTPTGAGSGTTGGGTPATLTSATSGSSSSSGGCNPCSTPGVTPCDCLICLSEGGIFGIGSAAFCVLTRGEAKAIVSALCIASGAVTLGLGVILMVAFGLAGSKTGSAATGLAAKTPGPVGSGAKGLRALSSTKVKAAKPKAETEPSMTVAQSRREELRNEKLRQGERPVKGERKAPSPFTEKDQTIPIDQARRNTRARERIPA
jgi:hypothetical protein